MSDPVGASDVRGVYAEGDELAAGVAVRKSYSARTVLRGLSFRVHAGEMLAVTGPSGCGKSTLLNIVGLLDESDGGELRLFGEPAPKPGTRAARGLLRNRLGYLFQNYALIDNQTVESNLKIAQRYVSASPDVRTCARREALAEVELDGFEKKKVYELSGGEQQRVAMARLLIKPCTLVLADEPTGSLDPRNRDAILALLRQQTERGKAALIVTHDREVARACDRTLPIP